MKYIVIAAALLCAACSEPPKPSPVVVVGTVVSCRYNDATLDVLAANGVLVHYNLRYGGVPACTVFTRGGQWRVQSHKDDIGYDCIDQMLREE